jgi:hypothetical protein
MEMGVGKTKKVPLAKEAGQLREDRYGEDLAIDE